MARAYRNIMSEASSPVELTLELAALLRRAVENESHYYVSVSTRASVIEVRSLAKHSVNGTNYECTVLTSPV